MERKLFKSLLKWKEDQKRKPLILQGARQVGKTWIMKEFGRRYFDRVAYFVFEKNSVLNNVFKQDMSILRILDSLSIIAGFKITKETLILFDEVQECPEAITSLKYFCEDWSGSHIIAAGSYLGIAEHKGLSFPVGKVNFLTLYPMDFKEFLLAMGEELACNAIDKGDFEVLRPIHENMLMWVKKYFYIGGMPRVVSEFAENGDYSNARVNQEEILTAYQKDFSKHIPKSDLPKARLLWRSIPSQLAKENQKFIYGAIKSGARAREFENCISWLQSCGLIYRIFRIKKPAYPISAYDDLSAFKLFLMDVGLLSALSHLDARCILENNAIFTEFKGALIEQFLLQQLLASDKHLDIRYWSNESSTNEIDFIVQKENEIIPIEVKAGINLQSKSLSAFISKFNIKKAYRFSSANYKQNEVIIDAPLYSLLDL